jgi:hypothetical protein
MMVMMVVMMVMMVMMMMPLAMTGNDTGGHDVLSWR